MFIIARRIKDYQQFSAETQSRTVLGLEQKAPSLAAAFCVFGFSYLSIIK